ncbi:MAG: hypothetical protein NVSMB32_14600 [Actinomycetota bacterium]
MDADLAQAFDRLEQAVGGPVFALVCQAFLQDFPTRLAELDAALLAEDRSAAISPAHTLKGDAASFGAQHLSELAARVEAGCRAGEADLDGPVRLLHDEVARVEQAITVSLIRRREGSASPRQDG